MSNETDCGGRREASLGRRRIAVFLLAMAGFSFANKFLAAGKDVFGCVILVAVAGVLFAALACSRRRPGTEDAAEGAEPDGLCAEGGWHAAGGVGFESPCPVGEGQWGLMDERGCEAKGVSVLSAAGIPCKTPLRAFVNREGRSMLMVCDALKKSPKFFELDEVDSGGGTRGWRITVVETGVRRGRTPSTHRIVTKYFDVESGQVLKKKDFARLSEEREREAKGISSCLLECARKE